eukprot:scaffold2722_cov197-Isochrysis_galbana.AAC.3
MSRAPSDASRWVSQLQQWDFERVIPAHFDAPINIGPKALDDAFAFLSDGKNEVCHQNAMGRASGCAFACLVKGKATRKSKNSTRTPKVGAGQRLRLVGHGQRRRVQTNCETEKRRRLRLF